MLLFVKREAVLVLKDLDEDGGDGDSATEGVLEWVVFREIRTPPDEELVLRSIEGIGTS
jgi:hypothetical protein